MSTYKLSQRVKKKCPNIMVSSETWNMKLRGWARGIIYKCIETFWRTVTECYNQNRHLEIMIGYFLSCGTRATRLYRGRHTHIENTHIRISIASESPVLRFSDSQILILLLLCVIIYRPV